MAWTVLFGIVGAGWWLRSQWTWEEVLQREDTLRRWVVEHPVLVCGAGGLLYAVITGLSIPLATPLSLLLAWLLGFWRAVVVVSFGSTAGATVAFLLSRYLLGNWVRQRYQDRFTGWEAAWEREGAWFLISLRLLPVVPFFVVNAVMGVTPIRVRTFWWASQVGMLPGTLVYASVGATAPSLRALAEGGLGAFPWGQVAVALSLLGVMPWLVRGGVARWQARRSRAEAGSRKEGVG